MENSKMMVSTTTAKILNEDNWEYVRGLVADRIKGILESENTGAIYTVYPKSVDKLHKIFINNIPESHRQHYTCNSCFMFINRIGKLVTIDDDGNLHSVCWDIPTDDLGIFKDAIIAMKNAVEHGNVSNVFSVNENSKHMSMISDDTIALGYPTTGEWTHFYSVIDLKSVNLPKYSMSEEEFMQKLDTVRTTLNKLDKVAVAKVLSYIPTGKIRDSDSVKQKCERLIDIIEAYKTSPNRNVRLKVMCENMHFLFHLRGSALGSLLEDLRSDIYNEESCIDNYNTKVDPINYMRPKSSPTESLIRTAEDLIAKLGMENSLKRRFALLSELPNLLWEKKEEGKSDKAYRNGVFSNVKSKENIKDQIEKQANYGGKMTLAKFINKILPDAEKLYVITRPVDNYCAYITAVDMDAPCIIKWDNPEARNPFSQYVYYKGSYSSDWNVHDNSNGVECLAIANGSAHLLDKELCVDNDTAVLFVLKDVYDTVNSESGLFPDILIGELYSIRKVIESFSVSTPLENVDGQKACGILYDGSRTIEVEVHTKYTITRYHIDRME